MKITLVAGARPNFMKIAPLMHALKAASDNDNSIQYKLVHTGQHYDEQLSQRFFDKLNIPKPDINLEVGSSSHAIQTAKIMIAFEEFILNNPTDWLIVVGDVNSTMACTIVAKKMNIKVAHVEAGLRSYDKEMPEEINRMITDAIADRFYTTTALASENLQMTNISNLKTIMVGNTMIDTLITNQEKFYPPKSIDKTIFAKGRFFLLTLHRPSNVDEQEVLEKLLLLIAKESRGVPIIFSIHPRTKKQIDRMGNLPKKIITCDPLPYHEFMYLVSNAMAVITDSGGIQEETTFLNVPCITLRKNTERPETITLGTNRLVGNDEHLIKLAFKDLFEGNWGESFIPKFWDGKAAERIINDIIKQ